MLVQNFLGGSEPYWGESAELRQGNHAGRVCLLPAFASLTVWGLLGDVRAICPDLQPSTASGHPASPRALPPAANRARGKGPFASLYESPRLWKCPREGGGRNPEQ